MKKLCLKVILLFMSFALIYSLAQAEAKGSGNPCLSQSAVQLKGDLRKLWTDHVIWTRNYIVSATEGLEDQQKVLERLLKNLEDLGNAIKPYYGEQAGIKLTELLREHILIAGKIVDAAKSGDEASVKKFNTEWYKNADDIAQFLSSANPNWPKKALQKLLYMHLKLVADDLSARLNKDWDADIKAFDEGFDHIIKMADTLTEGIIKQFPNKF
ncbi:glycosyltransferase [Bacillus gobiensis]|uniref:glycosyltransferase n=1 Tax=Bacillus gobiensis TaxID=1441095 RepID=UPI003D19BAFA